MMTPENLLKNRVPAEFAEAAVLTKEAGAEMLARLDLVTLKPERIVEVGCATGDCTALLSARYPDAEIHAFDADEGMLDIARAKNLAGVSWHCSESHILPLKEHSVDLLVANFVLPWCENPEMVLREWRRVLRPDGLLMLTTLGVDTLHEIQPFSLVLPHFVDMHNVGDALVQAGFVDPVMDVDYFTLVYRTQAEMFRELKMTGMMDGDLSEIQLTPGEENNFPATFEIIFGHAWAPGVNVDHVADEEGVVKIPVSHILRR